MDTDILAAVIGGVAAIVAAAIGLIPWLRRRSSRDEPDAASRRTKNRSEASYPRISDPEHLTRNEVHQLAEFYGLFRRWCTNPHLTFQDGDVSYWFEQELREADIRRAFSARRAVLEQAEEEGRTIATQGDLSALAQRIGALDRQNNPSGSTN